MTYSLPEIVKRNSPNRKAPVVLREIVPTKAQSHELAKIYLRVIRFWRDGAASLLATYNPSPLTLDSPDETEATLAGLTAVEATIVAAASRDIEEWIERVVRWHNVKWRSNVESATGISVESLIQNEAIREDLLAALRQNVALITNVSEQARERIAGIVWRGWTNRTSRAEVAREINKALGLGRRRSLLISSDQATKLTAVLTRDRSIEAGIDEFEWVHSKKLHPRLEHVARNGKIYKWTDKRIAGDLPGMAVYCGCAGRPVLDLSKYR